MNFVTCTLMKSLLVIASFLLCNALSAQVYVYEGDNPVFGDVLCNVNDGHILPERKMMWSESIVTVTDEGIYKGFSTSHFDILYTYEDGSLYSGDSNFTSDILYTWEDGVIYRGDSTFPLDKVFSYKDGKLYSSEGETVFDVLLTIEGDVSVLELFGILLALEMV